MIDAQISIGSQNTAAQHVHRTLMHPSSSSQPRHPMLKIVWGIAHKNDKLRTPSSSYTERCTATLPRAKMRHPACAKHHFLFLRTANFRMDAGMGESPCSKEQRTCSRHLFTPNVIRWCANDPSAGSPTETLLRLLLPLSDKVH